MAEESDADILKNAKDRYKVMKEHWSPIYLKARADLHFLSDEPLSQWDEQEAAARTAIGRPTVQIDQLGQFVHQVTNDIRMNTPTINVIPVDEGADQETAEILQGRIKAIEYNSNADAAYDLAADFSVKSSIGFIGVTHDYVNKTGFLQELKIKRIINPQACLIDNNSIEPDGSDSMDGFEFESMKKKAFEDEYPDATPVSFGEEVPDKKTDEQTDIVIGHYYKIVEEKTRIGLLQNGQTEPQQKGKTYKSTRAVVKKTVMHYKMADQDILERTVFPGEYVPLVPVYGEEQWIDGKRNLYSLIRKSKSSQQTYNLWKSLETELLMKQQQAPVQAAVGQMKGFEDDWKKPEKAMVLYYHQKDAAGNPAPAPQRLQPPTVPTGVVNAARETVDDIRATLGMYRASVGDTREQARSGVALKQLERSGDVATYHFGDNLNRSISHVGKILVCAMPSVEDTGRIVQTIGKEDEIKMVGINGKRVTDQDRDYHFTKGNYGVRVVTGASFTTQRQEAAEFYSDLITKQPQLMPIIGDLVFKYQDQPGAQAIAARLKKTIDPKLLDQREIEENAPDPQILALQDQIQQITKEAQLFVNNAQNELEKQSAENINKSNELKIRENNLKAQEELLKLKTENESLHLQLTEKKVVEHINKEMQGAIELINSSKSPEENSDERNKNFPSPMALKLDTTGFNFVKSPEEQAREAELLSLEKKEREQKAYIEKVEYEEKKAYGEAIILILDKINKNLQSLDNNMKQPILFKRDEAGNIIGAS